MGEQRFCFSKIAGAWLSRGDCLRQSPQPVFKPLRGRAKDWRGAESVLCVCAKNGAAAEPRKAWFFTVEDCEAILHGKKCAQIF
jgi:hypothetical protein